MFKKTYGILYEQNAYVFTDFFKELENYYAKGTVSIPFPPLSFLPRNLIISTLKWRSYDLFRSLPGIPSIRSDLDQFMLEPASAFIFPRYSQKREHFRMEHSSSRITGKFGIMAPVTPSYSFTSRLMSRGVPPPVKIAIAR